MIGQKIQDAFNAQINAELSSAYLYLSMSAFFESQNLEGMAHWMRLQAGEEYGHVERFFDFVHERGGRVILTAVEAPETEWGSPLSVFEATREHERKITALIGNLVELAVAQKDHAAQVFLQWFVTEQIEEESTVEAIVANLRLGGDSGVALLMLDKELNNRSMPLPPTA